MHANMQSVWSPKGDRIVFRSGRDGGPGDLYEKPVDGSRQDEPLLTTSNFKVVTQWSHDGRFVVYYEPGGSTQRDIWVLPVDDRGKPGGKPIPFVHSPSNETGGQLSPDSRWMAYVSDESGQNEVYVRPFPAGEGIWPISTAGGMTPRWRSDGKELFYVSGDQKMMAVPVRAQPSNLTSGKAVFEPGTPKPLFEAHLENPQSVVYQYDVTADGKRFLVNTGSGAIVVSPPLNVVVNWNETSRK